MSKVNLNSETDDQSDNTTIKMNPETKNLIRNARTPKKTLKERLDEFEEQLNKENEPQKDLKLHPISPIQINTEDEQRMNSARSNQRLVTSDEELMPEETKRRRIRKLKPDTTAIMETNVDEKDGRINAAFEDNEMNETTKDDDDGLKVTEKTKKKVRRAKKMPEATGKKGNSKQIIIHQTDKLRTDINIYHPVIRIHLLDLESDGQYVKKTKRERNVLYYYEKENRNLDHISPIMTSPFDFKENRSIIPRWEERVVFNEEFSHFIQEHPNVLIIFELLDSFKSSDDTTAYDNNNKKKTHTSQETGKNWQRIAWAFLKLVGSDKSLNIGKKIRLQLYYNQRQYRYNMIDSLVPEIYNLYKTGPRVKYPSSLHVTIKPIHPAKQFYLGIGSSYMINEEELDESNVKGSESSRGGVNENDPNNDENRAESLLANELPEDQKNRLMKKKTIIWSRLPGQACNVPNELALSLNSTKQGCYSVKFSTSGSYLACACVEEDNGYPILVFDIPDGKSFAKFYGHFGIVYEIAWSNLDKYILTASHDATVRVTDFENKAKDAFKILPHPSFIYSAKFHPHSLDTVCTSGYDKVIRVWSIGNKKKQNQKYGELLQELPGHSGYINSICFSADGNFLYSADSVGFIKLWNCAPVGEMEFKQWTFREDIEIDELKNQCISYIQVHPNRFSILIQTRDNQLKLIDTRVKMVVQRYKGTFNFSQNLKSAISPCGTFLFNSGSDTKIYCWNIITGDLVATPISLNYMKPARDIDFHPYDNYIAFCSFETKAPIYVFKYNPNRAMHEVIQSSGVNTSYENEILQEQKPSKDSRDKSRKVILSDGEDNIYSARNANTGSVLISMNDASRKPEFKYTGPKDYQELVVAIYDYTAQRNDELDFVKGDEIIVLVRENENWCLGELAKNRRQGYFPANYVQDKSHIYERNRMNVSSRYETPKYSVRDALMEYQKVYDQNALELMGIKQNPNDKTQSTSKTGNAETVNVINEIPTKDESEITSRRRDRTKRRTFAHVISGSHMTSSEI